MELDTVHAADAGSRGAASAEEKAALAPATKPETPDNDSGSSNPADNVYVAARGRIQRYVDIALLMSNMSMMATIIKRSAMFTPGQYVALLTTLALAMAAEIVAGILFFIAHEINMAGKNCHKMLDYVAYACVGLVMFLNMFASTFTAAWTETIPAMPLGPAALHLPSNASNSIGAT